MAGYSGTSLIKKLGWKERNVIVVVNAPDWYRRLLRKANIGSAPRAATGIDGIHVFAQRRQELEQIFPILKKHLKADGMIWVSWPKGSSGRQVDLNDNTVREIGLRHGLVDVKVAAIDETWSGLKFVYRIKDR